MIITMNISQYYLRFYGLRFTILLGLYVEKLKQESFPHYDIQQTVDEKLEPEKYPKNYLTCVNFFQVLVVLWNTMKIPGREGN